MGIDAILLYIGYVLINGYAFQDFAGTGMAMLGSFAWMCIMLLSFYKLDTKANQHHDKAFQWAQLALLAMAIGLPVLFRR